MNLGSRYFDMSQGSCKIHFQIMINLVRANDRTNRAWANKHAAELDQMMRNFQSLGGNLHDN